MKKLSRLIAIMMMASVLFACSKDDEKETVSPVLSVSAADKNLSFAVAGGSKTIVVTANATFAAVVENGKPWCTVSDVTESLFKVNIAANTEKESRTAKIILSLAGAPDVEIGIKQDSVVEVLPPAVLMVMPKMFHFGTPVEGERNAVVTVNRDSYTVTVESGKTWVTTSIDGNNLTIRVAASEVEAEREATITVHADGAEDVVLHVSQAAYVPPVTAPNATAKWTVAAPGNIEWYKWGANKTIGTPAAGVPATAAGPGGIQTWTLAKEDHVKITNPIAAPTTVYTLLWDIRVTDFSLKYRPLLQTKEDNNDDDADIFIRNKNIGLSDYSEFELTENTWHRIVVSVDVASDTKQAIFYVDGQPMLTKDLSSPDDTDRYTLQSIFWSFLDDNNEDNPIDCAGIAIWNTNLSAGEILSMGNAETPVK
jgi:hypothetical protein